MSTILKWAIAFAIIALIAGLFGFGGIAAGVADLARILFYIFGALVMLFLILGLFVYRKVT